MDKGKAVSTHSQSSDSSSSEDGGLIRRGQQERLNMPRFLMVRTRDQVAVDREFAQKLKEEERMRPSELVEIPGDEEFALRLQQEMEEAEQSGGDPDAAAKAFEIDFDETAFTTEDEEWEVNRGDMVMPLKEL